MTTQATRLAALLAEEEAEEAEQGRHASLERRIAQYINELPAPEAVDDDVSYKLRSALQTVTRAWGAYVSARVCV